MRRVLVLAACLLALAPLAAAADLADRVDPDGRPVAEAAPAITHLSAPAATDRGAGNDIDPGSPPEGDYLAWPVYTNDGQRVLLGNRGTDNVTVFDLSLIHISEPTRLC